MNMLGPSNPTLADAIRTVRYIRDNDLDFITVETIQDYANCDRKMAREAITAVMGAGYLA